MVKEIFLCITLLSLTACSSFEQPQELEETSHQEETVIELESNKETQEGTKFNQNNEIDSEIYKEFFFSKNLLPEKQMESNIAGDNKVAYGSRLPIGEGILSDPYYTDYIYNMSEEKLSLALILDEGSTVKEEELKEAIFVHLKYDNENDQLINITQENMSGENVETADLTEEEWIKVAERSIEFVDIIQ